MHLILSDCLFLLHASSLRERQFVTVLHPALNALKGAGRVVYKSC